MDNSQRRFRSSHHAFLSYSRADGEQTADELREKLLRLEPQLSLWQDRKNLEGGIGWWKQITEALDQVRFLIMVVTPTVFNSEIARKEWRYARQRGVAICPVVSHSSMLTDLSVLPQWVRKTQIYNLEKEWDTFIGFLKSSPSASRVPFMAPDLRDDFVPRPDQFNALLSCLLDAAQLDPLASTVALQGAGGFGKTTLATALCNNDDVIGAFDDGVLWASLGENPKLLEEVTKLYAALAGERPTFIDVDDASIQLAERLDEKNCLLVIDDVWDSNHLKAFLRGGKNCARLITTRHLDVVIKSHAHHVVVDEMSEEQSVELLTARLDSSTLNQITIKKLVRDLGEWPLLLKLASSLWIERVARGESVDKAFQHVARTLEKRGVTGYDRQDAVERNDAVTRTIHVSLERLSSDDQQNFTELAVFPEDVQIPISAVCALWAVDEFEADDILRRLDGAALLEFDLKSASVQVHDVLLKYLKERLTDASVVHQRLIKDAWQDHYNLPDDYAWKFIGWHLLNAGHLEQLRSLLLDVNWMMAKLLACDVHALLQDYELLDRDDELRLVKDAIRLSAHGLSCDATQLHSQLSARLVSGVSRSVDTLLSQCSISHSTQQLVLQHPSLAHSGGSLISILKGHAMAVTAIGMLPDTRHVITASADYTLRVWDLSVGKTIRVLEGHKAPVHCVAVSRDGLFAVSGSEDRVLLCWDIATGEVIRSFRALGAVLCVALSADSRWAITATDDAVIRLWDMATGQSRFLHKALSHQLRALVLTPCEKYVFIGAGDNSMISLDVESGTVMNSYEGHLAKVVSIAMSVDGKKLVTGSVNGTLRLWDVDSTETLTIFEGHESGVECVAVTADGQRIVSGSRDQTIRVWDVGSSEEVQLLEGHAGFVHALALTPNGLGIVSVSGDKTVRQWTFEKQLNDRDSDPSLRAHLDPVSSVSISADGTKALSGSRTGAPKVWEIAENQVNGTLLGHTDYIKAFSISPDGMRAITAAGHRDRTLCVWDTTTQAPICKLTGHGNGIQSLAVAWGAERAISLGKDRTLWLWDIKNGRALRKLGAVNTRQLESFRRSGRVLAEEVESVAILDILQRPLPRDSLIAISSDGTRAIAGFEDTLCIWNLIDGGTQIENFEDFDMTVVSVTDDGSHVLIGTLSGKVALWNLSKAAFSYLAVARSDSRIVDLAFNEKNNEIVCATDSGHICFCPVSSEQSGVELESTFANFDDTIIAPAATFAFSVYGDTIVAVDVELKKVIGSLSLDYGITSLAVVPDGSQLAIGDEAGGVHFVRLGE